jgi:hypothetical protein
MEKKIKFEKHKCFKTFEFDNPSTILSKESSYHYDDRRLAIFFEKLIKLKLKILPPNKKLLYSEKNPIEVNEKTSDECNKSIKIVHQNLLENPKLRGLVEIPQKIDYQFFLL